MKILAHARIFSLLLTTLLHLLQIHCVPITASLQHQHLRGTIMKDQRPEDLDDVVDRLFKKFAIQGEPDELETLYNFFAIHGASDDTQYEQNHDSLLDHEYQEWRQWVKYPEWCQFVQQQAERIAANHDPCSQCGSTKFVVKVDHATTPIDLAVQCATCGNQHSCE